MPVRSMILGDGEYLAMPTLVTGERLKAAVADATFIQGGDVGGVESVKYDFRMGSRILKATYGQPKDIDTSPEQDRWVDPGEAVFLLTKESLNLPNNMIAVLSPKRRLAHNGIMMLGGLAIDPCYQGNLLLGLYNFSSTRYPLRPGSKLIAAVFYELDEAEACEVSTTPEEVTDFPDDLIRLISNYKPVELKGLQDALSDTQRQLDNLRTDLVNDKTWRDEFKQSLSKHDQQLGALIQLFEKEQETRNKEDEKIRTKLDSMSNLFFGGKLLVAAAALVITAAITAVITFMVTHAMDPKPTMAPSPAATSVPPSLQGTASGK